jgi:hypothetical protein
MRLRDTELIGRRLVKYGFYRSKTDHQNYRYFNLQGAINIQFQRYGVVGWSALIVHEIDAHTTIKFDTYEALFTPEWLVEEHKKLQAMFKFLRL